MSRKKSLKEILSFGKLEGPGHVSQAYRPKEYHDEMQLRASLRPINYNELTPAEQWEVDNKLGLLDWKG